MNMIKMSQNDNDDQIKQARKRVLDLATEGDEDYHDDSDENDHNNNDDQVKQAFDLLIF